LPIERTICGAKADRNMGNAYPPVKSLPVESGRPMACAGGPIAAKSRYSRLRLMVVYLID
jgi:hypothetical protein